MTKSVLIVGAGSGLSASLARRCKADGMTVVLAARDGASGDVVAETNSFLTCEASNIDAVAALSNWTTASERPICGHNPSARLRGPDLDPAATRDAIEVTCFGALSRSKLPAACWSVDQAFSSPALQPA